MNIVYNKNFEYFSSSTDNRNGFEKGGLFGLSD